VTAVPRRLLADVTVTLDGEQRRFQCGQVIDAPPGSALEKAIGAGLLEAPAGAAPGEQVAEEKPKAKPRKARNGTVRAAARAAKDCGL
jgi:hypothetical protein